MLETRLRALLLLVSASLCLGQSETVCNNASLLDCNSCINAAPQCSWCPIMPVEHESLIKTSIYSGYDNIRCRDESSFPVPCNDLDPSVLHNSFQNPQTNVELTENLNLSTSVQEEENATRQVRPQRVAMKLRQGDTGSFEMDFISLRNTPLDVYFVADVSASLDRILRAFRSDISEIANRLRNISSGFAIGFGSYVDKGVLPYSLSSLLRYTGFSRNMTECRAFSSCEPPYVYHHSINLTNDIELFNDIIANVTLLSGNLDDPESSMDALVQAALCNETIGWRDRALKMMFVVTDNLFHFAGDGKFAGLVQPNQGKCNLVRIPDSPFNEYEYVRESKEDYVSFWQIRNALEVNRIVPIFVIQFDGRNPDNSTVVRARNSYQAFAEELTTIQPQVFLFNDEDDTRTVTQGLINVIQEAFDATVQIVRVGVPRGVDPPGYRFDITPIGNCTRNDDTPEGACLVDFDETVRFNVSVTLENCSLASQSHQTITLQGGPYQFTVIELDALCDCDCSAEEFQITNESVCTMGQGDLVCGVCECETDANGVPLFDGPECQCPPPPPERTFFCANDSQCSDFPCDVCGNCLCNTTSFGDDCSCDITDDTCEFGRNPLTEVSQHCSGPERGTCICERQRCQCNTAPLSGFTYFRSAATQDTDDNNCECDPDECFNPDFPGGLCYSRVDGGHNNGQCRCSGCLCTSPQFEYRRTCTSLDLLCQGLSECVSCFLMRRECAPPQECPIMDCHDACFNHTFSQQAADEDPITTTPDRYQDRCELTYTDNCVVEFFFSTDSSLPVLIENDNQFNCPASITPWIIAGSLVGAILIIGLLALIILKICLVFLERMEYRKFTQELKDADFAPHENPLYITPQQDYQNPIRRSSTRRSQ